MSTIELDCVQGSPEWHAARCGVVTASEMHRIITPAKLAPASAADNYMYELLNERRLGYSENEFGGSYWTERGHEYEGEAIDAISIIESSEPRRVGLVYRDESRSVGCSPDALLGDDGGAEIKCPKGDTHISYMLAGGVPRKYRLQVQACLWITGRDWWVFCSYHPEYPPHVVRVEPEPEVQAALDEHVPAFLDRLETAWAVLESRGVTRA